MAKFRNQRVCNLQSFDAPGGIRYVYHFVKPKKPRTDIERKMATEKARAYSAKQKAEMLAQREVVIRRRIEDAAARAGVLTEARYLMAEPEFQEWLQTQNGGGMDWASDARTQFYLSSLAKRTPTRKDRKFARITYDYLKLTKRYDEIWSIRMYYLKQATPSWCDQGAINALVLERQRHDVLYPDQAPFHLDHIVPLKSRKVCGLHVAENLRIIPGKENLRKKNKFNLVIDAEKSPCL